MIDTALEYSIAFINDKYSMPKQYAEFECEEQIRCVFQDILKEFFPISKSDVWISHEKFSEGMVQDVPPISNKRDYYYSVKLNIDKDEMNFLSFLLDKRIDSIKELEEIFYDTKLKEAMQDECYNE